MKRTISCYRLPIDGKADFLLTGDKDLLTLNPWNSIQIVSIADFKAYLAKGK